MSSYREIDVLDETKPILLVQDTDTRKMYVKKPIPAHNRDLYNKLQAFSFSGIPQIHEFCETEEGLFLYEDYISGQTLQTVLDDSFNLPEDAAVDIICQRCYVDRCRCYSQIRERLDFYFDFFIFALLNC